MDVDFLQDHHWLFQLVLILHHILVDCVDVWAPGSSVHVAAAGADDDYHSVSGTSLAAPYVTGVIANYLAEYDETNYHEPCEWGNIIRRLRDPHQTVTDSTKCEPNFECHGLLYDCYRPMCMLSFTSKCLVLRFYYTFSSISLFVLFLTC